MHALNTMKQFSATRFKLPEVNKMIYFANILKLQQNMRGIYLNKFVKKRRSSGPLKTIILNSIEFGALNHIRKKV